MHRTPDAAAIVALTPWQLIRKYGLRERVLTQVAPQEIAVALDTVMPGWRTELANAAARAWPVAQVPAGLDSRPEDAMDVFAERVAEGVTLLFHGTLHDGRTFDVSFTLAFDGRIHSAAGLSRILP